MPKQIPVKPNRLDAQVMKFQADHLVASYERMQAAKVIYDQQPVDAQDAIDRLHATLTAIGRKQMWAQVSGKKSSRVVFDVVPDAISNNAFYMAVEIVKDLTYMDINIAGFKWPDGVCISCGNPTRSRKKVKR